MILDYLRLALATALVLMPGWLVARALGQRSLAATFAWAMATLFVAWAVVFTVHGTIALAAAILGGVALVAGWLGRRRPVRRQPLHRELVGAAGVVLGLALWRVEGVVVGDGLFHEARVRKLVALGNLHLRTVDEFKDGGLHPGYAFPLWHGFLALVSSVSGLDPGVVVRHEPSLLVPIACVLGWEAGVAVFGSPWAGVSLALVQAGLFCFAPGNGGSYAGLALPATASRQLLAPAATVLVFFWVERGNRAALAALAAAFGALTLVHPTYSLFLLVPLAAAALLRPREWRRWALAFVAALVPTGLALVWLKPIADETLTRDPSAVTLASGLKHYASELVVVNEHHYRLAAQVLGRTGTLAVAALLLAPVCGFAARRRWAAFALGGTVLMLTLMEVPWLFVHLSDAVSLSQSRRAAGFAPLPFVLVGALALAVRSVVVLPVVLAGGIVLQRLWPGDFAYGLRHGGPGVATWIALIGGAVALALGLLRSREPRERHELAAAATALLVLPVAVHGLMHWTPANRRDPLALPAATVTELRTRVPKGAVVIGAPEASYRAVAAAPVYAVALPIEHVANTVANAPAARLKAVRRWLRTHDPAIAREYGATWEITPARTVEPLP